MHLELEPMTGKNFIQSFQPGIITINNFAYTSNLIISENCIEPWNIQSIDLISEEHLQFMLKYKPEVIIIGTGDTSVFLPTSFLLRIQQQGIGVEAMTTAAACRTFNVLLTEGRHTVAALYTLRT